MVAGAFDRRPDRARHSRHRRVRHPRRALSRSAQSGQGGHDPGARPVLHNLDHCARGCARGRRRFALGDVGASTAALAPALLGMAAGGALRGRFSEQTFRRVFFGGLLVLGAHLASRALIKSFFPPPWPATPMSCVGSRGFLFRLPLRFRSEPPRTLPR